jgi:hypothetical protein
MFGSLFKGFARSLPLRCVLLLLLALSTQALLAAAAFAASITEFRVLHGVARDSGGGMRLATRSFKSDGIPHLLLVDPVTLQTADVAAANWVVTGSDSAAALAGTPLLRALHQTTAAPYPLQNDGATRAIVPVAAHGLFLTVDLCPSKRPFEQELFDTVTAGTSAPVPVALAVTGVWLKSHPDEVAYLKRAVATGKLAITWVNHSFHHPYEPKTPLAGNFLLTPGTDFSAEVLEVETLLLSQGLVPSIFFRFPGLVSDEATVKRLRELSLIPIGSDAWLAKGETPREGSFILVHGNGNEPKGIKLALPLLRRGDWQLLPLPVAFGGK